MVLLHVKRLPREENSRDCDEFLLKVPNADNIGAATDLAVKLQNTRLRLKWMTVAAKDLAKNNVGEDQAHILQGPAGEAERYLAIERTTEAREETSLQRLHELCELIKGAAMMCFPDRCSGVDAQQRLAAKLDSDATDEAEHTLCHRLLAILDDNATTEDILQGSVLMWWSGKPLAKDCDFTKYVGKNEKTKIVVKLTKEGATAPPREMAIDGRTQSEMMAYWYKKQEEHKKLVEDDDISFGNSDWANPTQLKSALHGTSGVSYRPR
jgi:hypothetical protein